MEKTVKKWWFGFIIMAYALALLCLFIANATTAYALTERLPGVRETNPFTNSLIANYGVTVGLTIAFFYDSALILCLWVFFIPYLRFSRKHDNLAGADSLLYPLMSAWGTYSFIAYFMDATNDVSWILFHRSPISTSQLNEVFSTTFLLLLSVIFFTIFWILWHLTMIKHQSKAKPSA